ncbi:hypothetical protein [Paenibacillus elgii]|uniref:hypothetical protein n=1 Tax=Paenibacillus elgii TaxID=189691 RepID=UPI0013CFA507|nr:hypothetical protein [Paenibacillus elgii]
MTIEEKLRELKAKERADWPRVKVGLIKGRHPLPVESYLIEQETVEFDQAHRLAYDAMLSFIDSTERNTVIKLYITGLTRCTLGAVAAFQKCAGSCTVSGDNTSYRVLEIHEYNAVTGEYESVVEFYHGATPNDTSVDEYGYMSSSLR